MRRTCILLVCVIFLLTLLSAKGNAEARILRTLTTADGRDATKEERAVPIVPFQHAFNSNALDDIAFFFKKMPEQFQKMRTQPEHLRFVLKGWYDNLQSVDDIVVFLARQNLNPKAIEEFKTAYQADITYAKSIKAVPAVLSVK
ncbi:hypothetical protein GN244_ATG16951 [Phytophthora infestans]|uniref:Secreted RxLR effector peptide protein n=1 Tax=Phytophthora infestans TaxID=4787 RepID=A0A833W701_PHYIN|nr:hypothetical protein GN244_ATG16951 [Phytophthora infestans]KAF4139884.1 hypothetical protein GN958_ATG10934 [Phytophthora infestans]KAF4141443.1 hypothetical protein GN958_ATG09414 [Phytophthora infestans]